MVVLQSLWVFIFLSLSIANSYLRGACVLVVVLQRFKHMDGERPGVPVTGMGLLIGILPSGQVHNTHSQTLAHTLTLLSLSYY